MYNTVKLDDAIKYLERKYKRDAQGNEYKTVQTTIKGTDSITVDTPANSLVSDAIDIKPKSGEGGYIPIGINVSIATSTPEIEPVNVKARIKVNGEYRREKDIQVIGGIAYFEVFPIVIDNGDTAFLEFYVDFNGNTDNMTIGYTMEKITRETHDVITE